MNTYRSWLMIPYLALLMAALAGCSGGHAGTNPLVFVKPSRVMLAPGETQEFAAGGVDVGFGSANTKWEVVEGSRGGQVEVPQGAIGRALYTAPVIPGTYHVRCTETYPTNSLSATATVIVKRP